MSHRLFRHAISAMIALAVSAVSLVGLAYLSEYVRPPVREPVVNAEPIIVAEPPKRKQRETRPKPMKAEPVRGPEMPTLDLPSMIQAPSLRARDPGGTTSLVRPGLSEDTSFAPTEDLVMSEELVDEPPRAILNPAPRYPASAQGQGIEGWVKMRVLLDRQGSVAQVVVTESKPSGVFDDAAVEAIGRWRFSPATFKGQSVQVWVRKTLTFRLE